jgi:hypothetical protein
VPTSEIHIILLFVKTPRKFITAKLSIRKPGSSSVPVLSFEIPFEDAAQNPNSQMRQKF